MLIGDIKEKLFGGEQEQPIIDSMPLKTKDVKQCTLDGREQQAVVPAEHLRSKGSEKE